MTSPRIAIAIVVTVITFVATVSGLFWLDRVIGTTDAFIISLVLLAAAAYTIRNRKKK